MVAHGTLIGLSFFIFLSVLFIFSTHRLYFVFLLCFLRLIKDRGTKNYSFGPSTKKVKYLFRMLWPGSPPYTEADILAGERSRTDLFALVTVLHFALIEEIEKKGILCLFGPFSCFQSIEM